MKKYKVIITVTEVSTHEQTISANSREEAEALVTGSFEENGYPETDDFETVDIDVLAEEIEENDEV